MCGGVLWYHIDCLCVCQSVHLSSIRPYFCTFYIPPHNIGRVLWYHVGCLCVGPSFRLSVVCPSICPYFHFWMITWVNINRFSPNLVCVLILWRSGLGLMIILMDFTKLGMCIALILWRSALRLLMGKSSIFFTELSACNTSVFYFQDNNLSKSQWIFTKLDICFDSVEICLWIAHGQISSIFDRVICP